MRKSIAVYLICLVLLCSIFVGCANTKPSSTPTPTPRVTDAQKAPIIQPTQDTSIAPQNSPSTTNTTTTNDATTSPDTAESTG